MVLFALVNDNEEGVSGQRYARVAGDSEFYKERECHQKGIPFKDAIEAMPIEETEKMWMNSTPCIRFTPAKKRIQSGIEQYAMNPVKVTAAAVHCILRLTEYELYKCFTTLVNLMTCDEKNRRSVVLPRHIALYDKLYPLARPKISQSTLNAILKLTENDESVDISWNFSSEENTKFLAEMEKARELRKAKAMAAEQRKRQIAAAEESGSESDSGSDEE